jgi:hypothetical protein
MSVATMLMLLPIPEPTLNTLTGPRWSVTHRWSVLVMSAFIGVLYPTPEAFQAEQFLGRNEYTVGGATSRALSPELRRKPQWLDATLVRGQPKQT